MRTSFGRKSVNTYVEYAVSSFGHFKLRNQGARGASLDPGRTMAIKKETKATLFSFESEDTNS